MSAPLPAADVPPAFPTQGPRRTILFEIAHPKHFLQFRHAIAALGQEHQVHVLARDKDVVLRLLQEHGVPFRRYGANPRGLARKVMAVPRALSAYARLLRELRPDLVVSKSSPYAAVMGRFFGARAVAMPDSEGVVLNERLVIPLSDWIVTPASLEREYGAKHRRVSGFFETGYLHPAYFRSDPSVAELLGVAPGERYALLRFVAWSANHDVGKRGIGDAEKERLVGELSRRLRVFVSAEGAIPAALEPYRVRVPASRIHDVLHRASLYVGDSQTMATEAALLGTPAVRCNSFVGPTDFSNFRILEEQHGLLYNCADFDSALARALQLADDPLAKERWREGAAAFFAQAGDVNAELLAVLRQILAELPSR